MSAESGAQDDLFRTLLDASNDLIFVIDPGSGEIVDANATAGARLGYDADELLGTPVWRVETLIGHVDAWQEHVDWVRRRGASIGEGRMRRKDDSTFPVETNVKHVRLGEGEYMVAVARDISERERAQRERDSQLALFRSLIDNMQDGVLVERADRTVVSVNRILCETFELPPSEELIGESCAEAARASAHLLVDPEWFVRRIEEIVERRELVTDEELRFADGRIFERDHIPIVRANGDFVGHMWQYRDVTERREVRRRELELIEELRTLDRLKDAFLEAASHEIRTPLTTAVGFAHTLHEYGERMGTEQRLEITRSLNRSVLTLRRVLEGLLDLEGIRRGAEPRRQPADVSAIVRQHIEEVYLGDRTVTVDAPPVVASVDGTQVARIVETLLVNIAHHTPPGTPAWVRVEDRGDAVLLVVEDAGPGVADEYKEAVFRPFQTARTTPHSPGLGAGLALVAGFARLHGGRAWVEDREGGGASFKVLLPDAESAGEGSGTGPRSG